MGNYRVKGIIVSNVIDLVGQGISFRDACIRVGQGYHEGTIRSWFKKDERLQKVLDKVKTEGMKELIENGFTRLATGYVEEEVTEEWMDTKVINGEEVPVKRVKKQKVKAPSEKALMALAAKYDKGQYKEVDSASTEINIRISQKDRSLTTEERLRLLESEKNSVVNAEYRELSASDEVTSVLSGLDEELIGTDLVLED